MTLEVFKVLRPGQGSTALLDAPQEHFQVYFSLFSLAHKKYEGRRALQCGTHHMDPQNAEPMAAAVGTLIVEVPQTVHGRWVLQFLDMVVGGSVPPMFHRALCVWKPLVGVLSLHISATRRDNCVIISTNTYLAGGTLLSQCLRGNSDPQVDTCPALPRSTVQMTLQLLS